MPQIKPAQPLPPAPRWSVAPSKLYSNVTSKVAAVNARSKANVKPMVVAQPRVIIRNNVQSKKPVETKYQPVKNVKIIKSQDENIYENIKVSAQNDKLKSALTNFDKIINEYNTMSVSSENLSSKNLAVKQQSKSVSIPNTPASAPKLQKSKTCSIIEAHCILKNPTERQSLPDVKTRLVRKTLQPQPNFSSKERAKSVWDVSAAPPKISTRARSTSCVRTPSRIPVKKIPQKNCLSRTASADQFSSPDRGSAPAKPNVAKLSLPIKACVEKFESKTKSLATPVASLRKSQEAIVSKKHVRGRDYIESSAFDNCKKQTKKVMVTPKLIMKDVVDYIKSDPGKEYNSDCSDDSGHISNENEPPETPRKVTELLAKFEKRKTSVDQGFVENTPAVPYQQETAKEKEVYWKGVNLRKSFLICLVYFIFCLMFLVFSLSED